MAQVILGGVGAALGGGVGQVIGAALGGVVDRGLIGALQPARHGPRLEALKVQSSADGAPMACVFGRARVTGQVIWAARFLERKNERRGGKGGPRTVDYAYSLSFAVALCEGPIDGIGRVWADGRPMDMTGVTMRLHRGLPDQTPDPLIVAVEGEAAAYRGTAYVVFEDLPLGAYGNRPPQLSFEVFRRPEGDGLEERLEGVCLIPGAGEFMLATAPVLRREGLTRTRPENVNNGEARPDLTVALDQLEAQLPNLKRVSLVIGWFGDDLRAGHCRVRPGVERRDKATEPETWSVAGLDRGAAHLISEHDGAPAYGGTPSDDTVRQAVAAMKARGWAVTLYPFVFMDVPADNALPDPYGGVRQAPYPWRGRITGPDGAGAEEAVDDLFGAADGWGLRRLALHYAALAAETGADGMLIGSEMRGLTHMRDADGGYPAVTQLKTLAAECRAVVGPDVALSYAADWSEYFGHRPDDGSGDVIFHLDPLWADANIDYVGIDWYAPMGDWGPGDGGLDGEAFRRPTDRSYLAAQVAGGEGFDWYYADDAARAAQARSPIVDTAHGEHWVFRNKDLVGWWSNAHHDRPGGARSGTPTAWVPGMKPIRLTEFGCAAVDRGCNAPNLFQDPKSAENALPPHSDGRRDDLMQRRVAEALLFHFDEPANNPISPVYGGPMMAALDAWCWDARSFPAFPARGDVWADTPAWWAGHWLTGRMTGDTAALLAAILRRGGLDDSEFDVEEPDGRVSGYVIDRPMRTRDALAPLVGAVDLIAAERDGKVALIRSDHPARTLDMEALALPEREGPVIDERRLEPRPGVARVRFIDETADYQTGSVSARSDGTGGGIDLDLPAVCAGDLAQAAAERMLAAGHDEATAALGPLEALRLEAGDAVTLDGSPGRWRVERLELDETPRARLSRIVAAPRADERPDWRSGEPPVVTGAPFLRLLEPPPRPGETGEARPVAALAADPWRPMRLAMGASAATLTVRATAAQPATVGVLVEPLGPGCVGRWDRANSLRVRIEGQAPSSAPDAAVFAGANAVAVEGAAGWEVVQFRTATLIGGDVWRLDGLLRGQRGTEPEMRAGAPAGATVVVLDAAVVPVTISPAERGLPLLCRAGPDGAAGMAVTETTFTPTGRGDRPWRPAHLRTRASGADLELNWIARAPGDGDGWGGPEPAAPVRFRVRVTDGETTIREWIVESAAALYAADTLAADFPEGPPETARITVAGWREGYGWGVEAVAAPWA